MRMINRCDNQCSVSHSVNRFSLLHFNQRLGLHRDADETKEWIEEKNQALNTDNYGHDLASVQALQRKHEGFERDLAALGDKVSHQKFSCSMNVSLCLFFLFFLLPCLGEFSWRDSGASYPVPPRGSG